MDFNDREIFPRHRLQDDEVPFPARVIPCCSAHQRDRTTVQTEI
jgi:hypothetical protein